VSRYHERYHCWSLESIIEFDWCRRPGANGGTMPALMMHSENGPVVGETFNGLPELLQLLQRWLQHVRAASPRRRDR
jgi:hypothetical protein